MTDAIIRYAIMAGQSATEYDIAHNQRGYHRDQSNSPFYRDAYDAAISAADSKEPLVGCTRCGAWYHMDSHCSHCAMQADIALIKTLVDD